MAAHTADVAIIGAGVLGTALGWRLARAGASVVIIDGGEPGQRTSARSVAWINASSKVRHAYPEAYFRLNQASVTAYPRFAEELGDGSWFHPTGTLEVATDVARLRATVERLAALGYPASVLDEAELRALEPSVRVENAAWYPGEAWADGRGLVDALTHALRASGGTVVTGDAVTELRLDGGRVTSALLRSGDHVTAGAFVAAAGVETAGVAAMVGARIPLAKPDDPAVPGLIARFAQPDPALAHMLVIDGMHVRPDGPGRLLLAADDHGHPVRSGSPADVLAAAAEVLLERARAVVPALAAARFTGAVVGERPMPVDQVSIVGWTGEVPNLYVLVTHSGMTLAPHLSRLAAGEISGGPTATELEPFRPTRFG